MWEPQSKFCNPSDESWRCCYIGKRGGEKRGGMEFKFPPKKAKPSDMGEVQNRIHGWNALGTRIMAGQLKRAKKAIHQIGGRPATFQNKK